MNAETFARADNGTGVLAMIDIFEGHSDASGAMRKDALERGYARIGDVGFEEVDALLGCKGIESLHLGFVG